MTRPAAPPTTWWWGFALYALVSAVHVLALGLNWPAGGPTKLLLMPVLAVAVLWARRGTRSSAPLLLLIVGITCSWIGDGAGIFFPFFDAELPMMLLFFGLAHVAYIWLFVRHLGHGSLPRWTLVYAAWWVAFLIFLWPSLGTLAVPVALYGLILGGTAASAARCGPVITAGAALFLSSDTILGMRIFRLDLMPDWTSPLVMLTYCAGQGLIALGAVIALRRKRKVAA